MQVTIFANANMLAVSHGYRPGDQLTQIGSVTTSITDDLQACEYARAAGTRELRVGDVVSCDGRLYAFGLFGFTPVPQARPRDGRATGTPIYDELSAALDRGTGPR